MSKIITVTFNPALDKSIAIPKLVPEKKLKCSHQKVEPGGGGINVSRAIYKLGGYSEAVYLSGGYTGKQLEALLLEENILSASFPIRRDTRENFIVFDESANLQYRFGMDGPYVETSECSQVFNYIEQQEEVSYIIASGSLPPGVPVTVIGQLALIAKQKNARLVVDSSGEALRHAVNEGVFLIKPNLGELSSLYGKEKLEVEEISNVARSIINNGGCALMVISLGSDGAILVTAEEEFRVKPPQVTIHSTVGAGDSMVAGIVLAIANGLSYKEALYYGVAAGTAATLNAGTELCKKEDTERIFLQLKQQ